MECLGTLAELQNRQTQDEPIEIESEYPKYARTFIYRGFILNQWGDEEVMPYCIRPAEIEEIPEDMEQFFEKRHCFMKDSHRLKNNAYTGCLHQLAYQPYSQKQVCEAIDEYWRTRNE